METEKLQIVLNEGQKEVIIREGNAVNILDVRPPVKINLSGIIGAPAEFLRRRMIAINDDDTCQLDARRQHVLIDRENVSIQLVIHEDDEYKKGSVTGKLEIHPSFKAFGINAAKKWEPNELGQFFKMNRAFFMDKTNNMKLVTLLKSFNATIDTKIAKEKKENGSNTDNKSQVVNSNLPDAFFLSIPLFKGVEAQEIEIEFDATVNGSEITLQLCSPAANQSFEEIRDSVIDEQIAIIRELAPDIVIIEK